MGDDMVAWKMKYIIMLLISKAHVYLFGDRYPLLAKIFKYGEIILQETTLTCVNIPRCRFSCRCRSAMSFTLDQIRR